MKHEHRKTPWFDWRFTLCYLGLLAIIVLLNMLTLLHRLDSYVQSAQYQIAEIENYHNAVIVKLDRDSERMLQTVVPSFSQKPEAWRPLHAQLINKLIAAKVRVIVFDLFFNRVEAALDHEFQSALAHAQEESIAVVLSFSEELPAHPFYRAAYKGLSRGLAEEGSEVVKKLLLFDEFENGRGQAYPSLVAQAWSLWRSHPFMLEAQVHDGVLYCAQTRPIQQKKFWLLYAREEFEEYGYATILQWTPGREDTSLKGKAVFIGTALERDSHQVLGDQRKRHGVYLHAHAFNQLNAGAFVREISLEGKFLICLLLGVVFALYARLFQRLKRAQWLALAFVTLAFVLFGFLLSGILTPFATLSFAGITAILLMLKRKEATMKPVFIVHGRDETLLQTTARLVTQLGLDPIILR
ncbi:CHASE2 domain-containing protein, partial [candidate division KSB1 bacterium]|nr:CHASE2 domain-containing protein [candidate division KSB1 bacterium]